MNLSKHEILDIRNQFNKLENYSDLCVLLNTINRLISEKEVKEIQINEITSYAFSDKSYYRHYLISKRSGKGTRMISTPVRRLKEILKPLSIVLQCAYIPNECSHGFVWNKSIVSNARNHVNKNYVYNIDLKNFFHSIHQPRISKRLHFEPFNLNNNKKKLANLISRLCCFIPKIGRVPGMTTEELSHSHISKGEIKGVLPQGAATSPVLSNIICDRLDRKLKGVSKRFNVSYSRYADDITFSSNHNVYQNKSKFIMELFRIINEQNFEINEKKVRLQKKGFRRVVTGLIVNEKVNVHSKYIKEIRTLLYLIEKYGLIKAQEIFSNKNYELGEEELDLIPKIELVLEGKLEFVKMVKGKNNSTYLILKNRFEQLTSPPERDVQLKMNF